MVYSKRGDIYLEFMGCGAAGSPLCHPTLKMRNYQKRRKSKSFDASRVEYDKIKHFAAFCRPVM